MLNSTAPWVELVSIILNFDNLVYHSKCGTRAPSSRILCETKYAYSLEVVVTSFGLEGREEGEGTVLETEVLVGMVAFVDSV